MHGYERHVASTFLPLLDAGRHLIVTAGYVVVVMLTAMFAMHVAGWAVCRALRLRLVTPPSSSSSSICAASTVTARARQHHHCADEAAGGTFIHHRPALDDHDYADDDDDDDDDDDVSDCDDADLTRLRSSLPRHGVATSVSAAHALRHCYDSSPLTSSVAAGTTPSAAAAVEFKYSETNV